MARPDKAAAVEEITGRFQEVEAALLTEYRGLGVGDIAEVRRALRAADADYKVLKNTLTRIAVRNVGLDELVGMLEGPTAVAFCRGDAAAAAKALDDAARKFPVLVIKGGVLNGVVLDSAQVRELATLEPRDVQLAKIAMLMNQPAQSAVNVLAALLRDLGSMLAQVVQQKGSDGAVPEAAATETATTEESKEPEEGKEGGVEVAKTLSQEEVLDAIGNWTVLELSDFVKAFEDKFGVSAAAPVAVAAGPAAPGAPAEAAAAEEKDEFDVVLTGAGDKKIQVIKEVRSLTNLGLKEAKDLVDGAPKAVLERVNKEQAEEAKAKLEGAGASVDLK